MMNKPLAVRPALRLPGGVRRGVFLLVGLATLLACSPQLDWRELRPEGSGAQALFPCKPDIDVRPAPSPRGLVVCKAAAQSFSLSWAEVAEPAQVGAALRAMREALAAKLGAPLPEAQTLVVPGMTPQLEAVQLRLQGRDQAARVAVFARGLRVYQLTQLGASPDEQAWETFLTGLKLLP
jgi:hypothetical protein